LTVLLLLPLLLYGCATTPPVQEMSDARQAIRAAREANAQQFAPEMLEAAEAYLQEATSELDAGLYDAARRAALTAKRRAMEARDKALAVEGG